MAIHAALTSATSLQAYQASDTLKKSGIDMFWFVSRPRIRHDRKSAMDFALWNGRHQSIEPHSEPVPIRQVLHSLVVRLRHLLAHSRPPVTH